jgi:demethylmacrocin O-methyltransferase
MLSGLAKFYSLDKEASSGFHDYIPVYESLFESRRHSVKTFLEIGIGCLEKEQMTHVRHLGYKTGNSLRAWSYYFPNTNIYALDINPEAMIQGEDRIKTFTADQSNKEQLEAICHEIAQPLEIVIDDGSHQYEHQLASFIYLEPFLAPNAIYCIEDVHKNNLMKFIPKVLKVKSNLKFIEEDKKIFD